MYVLFNIYSWRLTLSIRSLEIVFSLQKKKKGKVKLYFSQFKKKKKVCGGFGFIKEKEMGRRE